jgi:hypothetical protein
MPETSSLVAARSFARSLNILLKTVRLYGADHERSASIMGTAFQELREILHSSGETGFLLGVSDGQVLLDGVPLDKRPTDYSFAHLLTTAGLSSINFSQQVTTEDFWSFVQAFSSRTTRTGAIGADLKKLFGGEKSTIKVNEVRFVAQDPSLGDTGLAAVLAARSLGNDAEKLQAILQDPQRLLQLIGAAEGSRNQPVAAAIVPNPSVPASAGPAQEDDIFKIFRWLANLGKTAEHPGSPEQIAAVETELSELPPPGQAALTQALISLNSQSEPPRSDDPLLVQLAERVAIQFALERYDRGEVKANAVVELLDRLKQEIRSLRDILKGHEERMELAGLNVDSHEDILDRQFWARMPDRTKQKMLLSPEAWAVPSRNIRQFIEELALRKDKALAARILDSYSQCVLTPDPEARRKAAIGITELADLYPRMNPALIGSSLEHLGKALASEGNPDLQSLLSAAFVRFSHEAVTRRQYTAVAKTLEAFDAIEKNQPAMAQVLQPRVQIANPLPEFIDEALREPQLPEGLAEVIRRQPQASIDYISTRLQKCSKREDWERMLSLVESIGPQGVDYLRKILQTRSAQEAASKIALLSRLAPEILADILPERLRHWDGQAHDLVVRQLAIGLAPQRGRLLELVYNTLNANVLPEVVDEMGMSGDAGVAPHLMRLLELSTPGSTNIYLQIKAVEALGRLRDASSVSVLRPILEGKSFWGWRYPSELRITSMQAMSKIDPDWAQTFIPRSGLAESDLKLSALDPDPKTPWLRQRRYERLNLPRPLKGTVRMGQSRHAISVQQLSLGGGVAETPCQIKAGNTVPMELRSGVKGICAKVLVREARPKELTFELVEIQEEDRGRLRRPLTGLHSKVNWRTGLLVVEQAKNA